jgi:hypothetical protein
MLLRIASPCIQEHGFKNGEPPAIVLDLDLGRYGTG